MTPCERCATAPSTWDVVLHDLEGYPAVLAATCDDCLAPQLSEWYAIVQAGNLVAVVPHTSNPTYPWLERARPIATVPAPPRVPDPRP